VGVIVYLGGPEVYSYASLVEMRDLAYGGGKYDNNLLPTWKAIDSGYEVTGTLNYQYLTVADNNPLGFLSTELWFLKFSIMPPKDFAPTADTKI
jgi:hypothetical protein